MHYVFGFTDKYAFINWSTLSFVSVRIFFISPKKFNRSVKNIKQYFSDRKILICREMTKFYEEFSRIDIDKLEPFKFDPKGELTIVISEKTKKILR